jgi:hypothetical protein
MTHTSTPATFSGSQAAKAFPIVGLAPRWRGWLVPTSGHANWVGPPRWVPSRRQPAPARTLCGRPPAAITSADAEAEVFVSAIPAGPWLLVVGMHRSGTSAITGALGALGLNATHAKDRMDSPLSNPEHWESKALAAHNDQILSRMRASWDAPPVFPPGWYGDPDIIGDADHADLAAVLTTAYPEPGPSVWKDPRLCLLLPYWRKVLPAPLAAVFVWRSPLDVAHSLQRRDQMPLAVGLALWERYNRSALVGLTGMDTYVLECNSMADDPKACVEGVAGWLSSLDQFAGNADWWDTDLGAASIVGELLHPPDNDRSAVDPTLLVEQLDLVESLTAMSGGHRPFHPNVSAVESGWTTSVIDLRQSERARDLREARQELARVRSELADANRNLANLHSSTSWRMTTPVRALVAAVGRIGRRRSGR